MDVGAVQSTVATISTVGFLIFFGSPTAVAVILGSENELTGKSEAEILQKRSVQARAVALRKEDAYARYFLRAFKSEQLLNSLYWLSFLYGIAALADLASIAGEPFTQTYPWYSPTMVALSVAVVLVLVAVATTLYGIQYIMRKAKRELEKEKADLLQAVENLKSGDSSP